MTYTLPQGFTYRTTTKELRAGVELRTQTLGE